MLLRAHLCSKHWFTLRISITVAKRGWKTMPQNKYKKLEQYLQRSHIRADYWERYKLLAFLCFQTKRWFNTTAVWKMLTNHKLVVAWQLLEAVCPVLLMRGGIPRKGITAQWLSPVRQFVQRKVALSLWQTTSSSWYFAIQYAGINFNTAQL